MSPPRRRWNREWYEAPPKRPPPKRGIKIKKAGATWWGKRWIEALERISSGYSNRLVRGKTYARAGRVHDLSADSGSVAAKVTGSREPYDVRVELAVLNDAVWSKAIAAMAAKAQFAAELLAGRMPEEIDEVFRQAGTSLFPAKASDLRTACSCPDWVNPCKHVAAVHFVLGEAFDRDPFLLFELRGRSKAQVLETLRAARAGETVGTGGATPPGGATRRGGAARRGVTTDAGDAKPRKDRLLEKPKRGHKTRAAGAASASATETSVPAHHDVATVSLGRLAAADYDAPAEGLPALHFSFDAPPVSGALLRQLGTPSGWSGAAPAERLGRIVRAAADAARRLALERSLDENDAPPIPQAQADGAESRH